MDSGLFPIFPTWKNHHFLQREIEESLKKNMKKMLTVVTSKGKILSDFFYLPNILLNFLHFL